MTDRRNTGDRRVADRRRSERSAVNCQIRLLSASAPSLIVPGGLLDASESGVRLLMMHPVSIGEKLLVEARRGARVVCNVTVQVIWVDPASNGPHVLGCESLSPLSKRQLEQLKSACTEAPASTSSGPVHS